MDHLKEQLLRVELSATNTQNPTTLMAFIVRLLVTTSPRKLQTRCGLLMLLSVWIYNCSKAVDCFLNSSIQIGFEKEGKSEETFQYLINQLCKLNF